jgi:hypothetical protein
VTTLVKSSYYLWRKVSDRICEKATSLEGKRRIMQHRVQRRIQNAVQIRMISNPNFDNTRIILIHIKLGVLHRASDIKLSGNFRSFQIGGVTHKSEIGGNCCSWSARDTLNL